MFSRTSLTVALVLLCAAAYAGAQMVGGLDEERDADEHIRKLVASVTQHLERRYPAVFTAVEPISYKTQVVAGMNYFVRATVTHRDGKKVPVHMRIYNPIRGPIELTAIKTDVEEKSPLRYFQ